MKRARRPLISEAILISVVWPTPGGRGATRPGRKIKRPRMAATATSARITEMTYCRREALDRIGGSCCRPAAGSGQCHHKIERSKQPQEVPVRTYFVEPGTHLSDSDQTVDRGFTRENPAQIVEHRRDHLARPGNANQKELRQGRRDKHQNRGFAVPEKAARCLSHKTGRQYKRYGKQYQIGDLPQSGEAIDPRQDNQKKGQ